jgi:Zn-finger nucleic acid-binding protein
MPSCPRCAPQLIHLVPVQARGFAVLGCHVCGGVFVDNDVFKVLVVEPQTRAEVLSLMGDHHHADDAARIPCPTCGEEMKRQRAGEVLLDVCKRDGIWFDHTELEQVVAQLLDSGMDKTYSPAVAALRKKLQEDQRVAALRARAEARQARQMLKAQQVPQEVQANGEPIKKEKKRSEGAEATFAFLELLVGIFEIFG